MHTFRNPFDLGKWNIEFVDFVCKEFGHFR